MNNEYFSSNQLLYTETKQDCKIRRSVYDIYGMWFVWTKGIRSTKVR